MNKLYKTVIPILLGMGCFLHSQAQNINATLRQKFVSSVGAANEDQLGAAIATDGNIAVIGANYDSQGGTERGAIYVLGKDVGGTNNWGLIKKIINGAGTNTANQTFINVGSANGDFFGFSVSLSGDVIAVSAPVDNQGATNRGGAVYLLGKDVGGADNWGLIKKLVNGAGTNTTNTTFIDINSGNFEFFGHSVSLSGSTLAVGSRFDSQGGSGRGAVYLFNKDLGGTDNWGLLKKVVNGSGTDTAILTFINVGSNDSDNFGFLTNFSGNTLAVGVPSDNQTGMGSTGAVYLLGKDEGGIDNWGLIKKIINGTGTNTANQSFTNIVSNSFDFFGASISLQGNTIAIGARFDDQGGSDRGACYILNKDAGGTNNWGVVKKLINGPGTNTANLLFTDIGSNTSDSFGYSVSLSGGRVAVGAFSDDQGGSNRGAAYIFGQNTGGSDNWGLLKKIINGAGTDTANETFINSGSSNNDLFSVVGLSGNTLAIGAFYDDQGGTNRGAAYLFSLIQEGCNTDPISLTEPITSGTVVYNGSHITATNQISNADVTYTATQSVTLNPGFSAAGNVFKAQIGGCN
jgi:FG-GAP repeat